MNRSTNPSGRVTGTLPEPLIWENAHTCTCTCTCNGTISTPSPATAPAPSTGRRAASCMSGRANLRAFVTVTGLRQEISTTAELATNDPSQVVAEHVEAGA